MRNGLALKPLDSKPQHLNILCRKGLTTKQTEYVYTKCKNEGIIGIGQLYECKSDDK